MFVYVIQWLCRETSATGLCVFLAVLLLVRMLQILKKAWSLPPGPWGYPVLGYLPFVKGDLHLHFRDLTMKYGSMFSTRLGSQLIVVLSDYKTIRDAFRKEEFTGRPNTEFSNILGGYGEYLFYFIPKIQKSFIIQAKSFSQYSRAANFIYHFKTITFNCFLNLNNYSVVL